MTTNKRSTKGSALTYDELDANFTQVDTNTTNIATNTSNISTNTSAIAAINSGKISVVGQWRLNGDVTVGGNELTPVGSGGSAGTFVEATGDASYTRIGSAMTVSSGVFTFPETGIYLIIYQTGHIFGAGDVEVFNTIKSNTDFVSSPSSFESVSQTHLGSGSIQMRVSGCCVAIVDIENVSTHKVRFDITSVSDHSNTTLEGNADVTITGPTFIKISDT